MPSPFPGMDPYLEEPGLWPDVQHGLISQMQAVLNRQLRPKYHVRVEERVYISDENDPGREVIIPDPRVGESRPDGPVAATLPEIPIPLRPKDDDTPLDLQDVLATPYDRAAYDLEIDYRQDPVPPLPDKYAIWAGELLGSKGLR